MDSCMSAEMVFSIKGFVAAGTLKITIVLQKKKGVNRSLSRSSDTKAFHLKALN